MFIENRYSRTFPRSVRSEMFIAPGLYQLLIEWETPHGRHIFPNLHSSCICC